MPNVSVVIPAYNQPQMLAEALDSVRRQTQWPAQIIVIDDCSHDPLEPEIDLAADLPVSFIRQEHNLGPASSVAHGIRLARCELIAVLNHDDTWEPDFIERLTHALDTHPEACIAFCDHGIMRADGRPDERRSTEQSSRYARAELETGLLTGARLYESAILRKSLAASSFALVRRPALDLALIEAGADMWDYFLAVGACRSARPAVYVAERLGWYRVSPTMLSATHSSPRKQIEMVRPQTAILLVILRSPRLRSIHRAVRKRLGGTIAHALLLALRTRDPRNVARAATRVAAGIRDARRLTARDPTSPDRSSPAAQERHRGHVESGL